MAESISCDVLIVGSGTGACAAAIAASDLGMKVVMTWDDGGLIGGQMTWQCVPPDEHPWIEEFGATHRYRELRNRIRARYKGSGRLTKEAAQDPLLNPGRGWVSRLCYEPYVGFEDLANWLGASRSLGLLECLWNTTPISVDVEADQIKAVTFDKEGQSLTIEAKFVLDATELGDLLPLAGAEYRVGAESKSVTGEEHAVDGPGQPENTQGFTWCAIVSHELGADHTIEKPREYEKWLTWSPQNWCGPLLSRQTIHPVTGAIREIPFEGEWGLLTYRQIVDVTQFRDGSPSATVINWPQNDYFEGTIIDVPAEVAKVRLESAKQLTLSLIYWLQTEAGLPGLYLRPDLTKTADGLAKVPYIRESRRIQARFTVTEEMVVARPGLDRAPEMPKSVGIGAYRIDLHPCASGAPLLDLSTLPFQIPLGSLVPIRIRNLIPACKNLGVTHNTNGCYRLHPVEWNIGEVAGLLAGFCIKQGAEPSHLLENEALWQDFEQLMDGQGIETAWPSDRTLRAL